MTIEFCKHQMIEGNPYWFELGITCMRTDFCDHKYVLNIALCFWSIHIRWGVNK